MIQKTEEDYIRTIYSIYEKSGDPTKGIESIEIAKELVISKPTVSRIVKKLTERGLVKSEPYSKIRLTERGMTKAKKIMYKHRIIEVFLTETLSYRNMKRIHEEAHKLEHSFSYESVRRIDSMLGFPEETKSGKEIPR